MDEKKLRDAVDAVKRGTNTNDGKIVPARKPIKAISAADLMEKDIPPVQWLVEKLLPAGLSLIGAPSKYFKSYMALELCVEICTGGRFLDHSCNKAACLYMDLESTQRRPQARLKQILGDRKAPDNLYILTGLDDVGKIGDGLEGQLENQLKQHPEIRLIVIDVFQLVRQAAKRNQSGYDRDYEDMQALKKIADSHSIGILLIHHTRKMADPSDPFNELSGSVGVMGALDCAWVITREKRDSKESALHITGRDLESVNLQVRFNQKTFHWESLGTAEEIEDKRRLEEYEQSRIVQTVRKLVEADGGEWTGTVEELKDASMMGAKISDDIRVIGRKIREYEPLFWAVDGIHFEDLSHKGGNRERTLLFYKK